MEEFRFGLQQRIYNRNMRVAREKLGLTQAQLGEMVGIKKGTVGHYETFRDFPKPERAASIAAILGVSQESIFPQWLKVFRMESIPKSEAERSLGLSEIKSLMHLKVDGPEAEVDAKLLSEHIGKLLLDLKERERAIIEMKFGLDGKGERTFEEIGQVLGINRARAYQIKEQALRKLRHPARSGKIKDFWPEYNRDKSSV